MGSRRRGRARDRSSFEASRGSHGRRVEGDGEEAPVAARPSASLPSSLSDAILHVELDERRRVRPRRSHRVRLCSTSDAFERLLLRLSLRSLLLDNLGAPDHRSDVLAADPATARRELAERRPKAVANCAGRRSEELFCCREGALAMVLLGERVLAVGRVVQFGDRR